MQRAIIFLSEAAVAVCEIFKRLALCTLIISQLPACGGGGDSDSGNPLTAANRSQCIATGAANSNNVNVLALYTDAVADRYNGDPLTRINHLMQVSRKVMSDSGVSVNIALVGIMPINDHDDSLDASTALDRVTDGLEEFADVEACRDALGADMVVLYRDLVGGVCGIAWLNGGESGTSNLSNISLHSPYMYSVSVPFTCEDYTTIHEMGHNWGLTHDYIEDNNAGSFQGAQPWARGHGVNNVFHTVEAYAFNFNAPQSSYTFSNPNLSCFGVPCGVTIGSVNQADSVSHLSIVVPQVRAYR